MKILNKNEMAECYSGYNWNALTLSECKDCFGAINSYDKVLGAIAGSFHPTGIDALFATCLIPLIDGIVGAAGIRATCPPCAQKIFAE